MFSCWLHHFPNTIALLAQEVYAFCKVATKRKIYPSFKFTMMLQFLIQYVFRPSISSTFYQRYKLKRQGMMYISQQHCKNPTVSEKVMQCSPENGATNTETCSS